jgi:hypothetical protein
MFTPVGSGIGALAIPADATAMSGLVIAMVALTALVLLGGGWGRRAS